jgi:hypothetical protein
LICASFRWLFLRPERQLVQAGRVEDWRGNSEDSTHAAKASAGVAVGEVSSTVAGPTTIQATSSVSIHPPDETISHAGINSLHRYWGEGWWSLTFSSVATTESYPWNRSELYAALRILATSVEFIEMDGQNHWILYHPQRVAWMETIIARFDMHLKGQPAWGDDRYCNASQSPRRRQTWLRRELSAGAKCRGLFASQLCLAPSPRLPGVAAQRSP